MGKSNYIRDLLQKRKLGIHCGIPSFSCCAKALMHINRERMVERAIALNMFLGSIKNMK